MIKLKTGLSCIVLGLALTACDPIKTNQGYHMDPEQLVKLETGVTTKDGVQEIMGSPSSIATFQTEGDAWYYISSKTEQLAFLEKEVTDRNIVVVKFNIDDVVETVTDIHKDAGQEVAIVERETPTGGRKLGFLEQLFGNLGRFNQNAGQ
ncbi:outer membrane protein assembly factor BamE [Sneathiella sp.]|uniref:outer membrane protein assembly factor BamE n=1 Tax=Sneathiella sp. TaxID=1964365 RepID=UPI003563A426